ncbi:MAG: hypothetical protein RSP_14830 [Rhodanobacter sp.]
MKRQAVLVFAMTMAIAGCGNSDINAVKKQTLGQDQSYTVEQAFDNRKVCDSVKWDEITDDRGRKIVEYRCTFNGVDDYFSNALANATKKLKDQYQSAKDAYGKDAQDDLSDAEKRLATLEASGLASKYPDNTPDDQLEAKVKHAHDLENLLNNARVENNFDKVAVTNFWDGFTEAEINNDPLHQAVATFQADIQSAHGDLSNSATWPNQARADLNSAVAAAASDEGQILDDRIRLPEAKFDVINAKKKLDSLLANKDQAFASLDADLSSKLHQLDANATTSVDELFQWSMSENGDPVFVFAGSEYKYKNGKEKLVNYYDVGTQHAMQAMIRNDTATYAQYVVETNLGG